MHWHSVSPDTGAVASNPWHWREILDWLNPAFDKTWFYAAMIVIALMYGFGGLVHIGNMLGFGELEWSESPLSWQVGDVVWGLLDIIVVVGILLKAPVGILALVVAALSQIIVYGIWPDAFALTDEHMQTLRGMVYFHVVVLAVLGVLVWLAISKSGA